MKFTKSLVALLCVCLLSTFVGLIGMACQPIDETEVTITLTDPVFRKDLYVNKEYSIDNLVEKEDGVEYAITECFYFDKEFNRIDIETDGQTFTQTVPYDVVLTITATRGSKTAVETLELKINFNTTPILEAFVSSWAPTGIIKTYVADPEYLRGDAETAISVRYMGDWNVPNDGVIVGDFSKAYESFSVTDYSNAVMVVDVFNAAPYDIEFGYQMTKDGIEFAGGTGIKLIEVLPAGQWTSIAWSLRAIEFTENYFAQNGWIAFRARCNDDTVTAPYDYTLYFCNPDITDYSAERFPDLDTRTPAEVEAQLVGDPEDKMIIKGYKNDQMRLAEINNDSQYIMEGVSSAKFLYKNDGWGGEWYCLSQAAAQSLNLDDWSNVTVSFYVYSVDRLGFQFHYAGVNPAIYTATQATTANEWSKITCSLRDLGITSIADFDEMGYNFRFRVLADEYREHVFYVDGLTFECGEVPADVNDEILVRDSKNEQITSQEINRDTSFVKEGTSSAKFTYNNNGWGGEWYYMTKADAQSFNLPSWDDVTISFYVYSTDRLGFNFQFYTDTIPTVYSDTQVNTANEWSKITCSLKALGLTSVEDLHEQGFNFRFRVVADEQKEFVFYVDGLALECAPAPEVPADANDEMLVRDAKNEQITSQEINKYTSFVKEGNSSAKFTYNNNGWGGEWYYMTKADAQSFNLANWDDVIISFYVYSVDRLGFQFHFYTDTIPAIYTETQVNTANQWSKITCSLKALGLTSVEDLHDQGFNFRFRVLADEHREHVFYVDGFVLECAPAEELPADENDEMLVRDSKNDQITGQEVNKDASFVKEGNSSAKFTYNNNGWAGEWYYMTKADAKSFNLANWADASITFYVYSADRLGFQFHFYTDTIPTVYSETQVNTANEWSKITCSLKALGLTSVADLHDQGFNFRFRVLADEQREYVFYVDGFVLECAPVEELPADANDEMLVRDSKNDQITGQEVNKDASFVKEGNSSAKFTYNNNGWAGEWYYMTKADAKSFNLANWADASITFYVYSADRLGFNFQFYTDTIPTVYSETQVNTVNEWSKITCSLKALGLTSVADLHDQGFNFRFRVLADEQREYVFYVDGFVLECAPVEELPADVNDEMLVRDSKNDQITGQEINKDASFVKEGNSSAKFTYNNNGWAGEWYYMTKADAQSFNLANWADASITFYVYSADRLGFNFRYYTDSSDVYSETQVNTVNEWSKITCSLKALGLTSAADLHDQGFNFRFRVLADEQREYVFYVDGFVLECAELPPQVDDLAGDELEKNLIANASGDANIEGATSTTVVKSDLANNTSSLQYTFTNNGETYDGQQDGSRTGRVIMDVSSVLYNAYKDGITDWSTAYIRFYIKNDSAHAIRIAPRFQTAIGEGADKQWQGTVLKYEWWQNAVYDIGANADWTLIEVSLADIAASADNMNYGAKGEFYTENVTDFKFCLALCIPGAGNVGDTATIYIDGLEIVNK